MSIKISKKGVSRLVLTAALAFSPLMVSETVFAQEVTESSVQSMSWEQLSGSFPNAQIDSITSMVNKKVADKKQYIDSLYRDGVKSLNFKTDRVRGQQSAINKRGEASLLAAAILDGKAGSQFDYGGYTWTYSDTDGMKHFDKALSSISINENTSWDELLGMSPGADKLSKGSMARLEKALAMSASQKEKEGSSMVDTGLHTYAEAMNQSSEFAKNSRAKQAIEFILVGKALMGKAPKGFLEKHGLEFSGGELKKK